MYNEPGVTHALTERHENVYTGGCGITFTSKTGMPRDLTGTSTALTCIVCIERLRIHRRVTDVQKLSEDLDDREVTKRFAFGGKQLAFGWRVGEPWLYVYFDRDSETPLYCVSVNDGKGGKGLEFPSYEQIQAGAKRIITEKGDSVGLTPLDTLRTHLGMPLRSAVPVRSAVPALPIYTGPRCDVCKKPDEGDCIPSPDEITKIRCMPCYVRKATI
jgi:hypothetical protein